MPIQLTCAKCDRKLRAKDSLAGKRLTCPGCKHVVVVPVQAEHRETVAHEEPRCASSSAKCLRCASTIDVRPYTYFAYKKMTITESYHVAGNVKTTRTKFNYSGVQYFSDQVCSRCVRKRLLISYLSLFGSCFMLFSIIAGYGLYFWSQDGPGLISGIAAGAGGVLALIMLGGMVFHVIKEPDAGAAKQVGGNIAASWNKKRHLDAGFMGTSAWMD